MKTKVAVVGVCILALAANAFGVYTDHIWDVDTQGTYDGSTIYVKGENSGGPDNSPLHESWNLVDEYIDSELNPHYIGGSHSGLFYRFIFYDGTLTIDPTGKVGFWEKMFASGNDATGYPEVQTGIVNVEGHLFGPELRPWKNGCPLELNVLGDGLLEISDILRVGISDGGVNTGVFNLSGGMAVLNNMDIYGDDSYIDITGGELLILNSNWDVDAVNAAIAANDIINTSSEGLYVTTTDIEGSTYTSVTIVPEPATVFILGLGGLAFLRRKKA